ncbi:Crp/Fnr family transcriptional regulator [Breznakiella homolactica]|uniref:Crp/Fnr family transcriptional regulator n=1 Tax=Breznakiella homolactica TaxID=2798577 RepID=A0A7T8B980_9SPIR|nr:Crp/Fnr family transcriptional regulator [Breznakiella homolactica]QQO09364.1 Crp/Fnr family transcriptional regulator [Breznakiella homolactica]
MDQTLPAADSFFPFWEDLPEKHRRALTAQCRPRIFKKGETILPYKDECLGVMLVQDGQFRAFILSEQGKEVTLYRLFRYDICLFSASCIMNNIQFDIHIEAEKDTQVLLLPLLLYEELTSQSLEMANHMNQIMSSRFSDVMWTLEQILFKSMDSRIAQFLLEKANIDGTEDLSLTHDSIARELCTAREVVTRMLNYFRDDKLLELGRGKITLLNTAGLRKIAG